MVQNLVDNAARHADAVVALAVRETEDGVELVVEDDGPGIPAEHRQRVFDRFVRLDEARARDAGGSGLGLAIVQEIVTAHGGTVDVSSSGLGGARFVVRLPGAAGPARPEEPFRRVQVGFSDGAARWSNQSGTPRSRERPPS